VIVRPLHCTADALKNTSTLLGAGVGNVFDASGQEDPEEDGFLRAYARLEGTWSPSHWDIGAEGTLWAVEGGVGTRSYARGTVAYEIHEGVSFDLTGEVGRQPPRFVRVQSFKIGFGFHHPFDRGENCRGGRGGGRRCLGAPLLAASRDRRKIRPSLQRRGCRRKWCSPPLNADAAQSRCSLRSHIPRQSRRAVVRPRRPRF
jgi:hypothetical protein